MSSWNLTQRVTRSLETQRQAIKAGRAMLDGPGEKVMDDWRELEPTIVGEVFVRLRGWIREYQKLRRPIPFDRLVAEERLTRTFAWSVWLRPHVLCLLLQVLALCIRIALRWTFSKMCALAGAPRKWIIAFLDWLDPGVPDDS